MGTCTRSGLAGFHGLGTQHPEQGQRPGGRGPGGGGVDDHGLVGVRHVQGVAVEDHGAECRVVDGLGVAVPGAGLLGLPQRGELRRAVAQVVQQGRQVRVVG